MRQTDNAPLTGGVGGQGELSDVAGPLLGRSEDAPGVQDAHLPGGHREGSVRGH